MVNGRTVRIWGSSEAADATRETTRYCGTRPPPPPPNGWSIRPGVPVVGAHGGSAATTITGLLAGLQPPATRGEAVYDAGLFVPGAVDAPAIVVTARGTAAGLAAAQHQVAAAQAQHQLPVVVIVTDDGPWPLPPAVRARMRALSGRARIVRLPYVARWRFIDTPTDPPVRYVRQLNQAAAAIDWTPTTTV